MDTEEQLKATIVVHGTVQGVGFRYWTWKHAEKLGLAGSAVNEDDGTVRVVAQGPRWAVRDLLQEIQGPEAPGVVLRADSHFEAPTEELEGFTTG